MAIHLDQYAPAPVRDLLVAATRGLVGIDHRFLRAIFDRLDEGLPELVRFGLEDRMDDPVRLEEDLIAIFRYRPRPEAVPFLVDCVGRDPLDIPDDLLDALLRLGAAALEPLLDLYRELGAEAGAEVAFVLSALRVRDQRILDLLLSRMDLDPGEAAHTLATYGDPAAEPALERQLAGLEIVDSHTEWVARELRDAIERLEHPEPPAVLDPYDIWQDYPETAPPRFDLLPEAERVEMLASALAEYREHAARCFRDAHISPEVKSRLFELAGTDPEPAVRASCWESLASAAEDEEIRGAMLVRLQDPHAALVERCGALIGLADHTDDPAVRRWVLEFYDLPEARAKAIEAMWRSLDRDFGDIVAACLEDGDIEVRRQAILGVGYLGLGAQAGRLRKYFDDEELRMDALPAYALAAPGETSPIRIRRLFDKIDDLAGGLSSEESFLVQDALNIRLESRGLKPVFFLDGDAEVEEPEKPAPPPPPPALKAGRNDPCPCGSGKKLKKCCGA